jgi:hypothetical protein
MFSILRQASKIANPMVNLIYANLRRPYAGFKVNPKPSCCQSWLFDDNLVEGRFASIICYPF